MARCKNKYKLPLKKKYIVQWSVKWSPAHVGDLKNSVDFMCQEGTPVYAAASGRVIWIRENFNGYGSDKAYWFRRGNRIVIKHRNGEYTAYEHLAYKGVVVKEGQNVKKGQLIGYSGNTGYSLFPHLHFEVFNNPSKDESEGVTLQVGFKELKH